MSNGDVKIRVPKRGNVRSDIQTPALSSEKRGTATNLKLATGCLAWVVAMHSTLRPPVYRTTYVRKPRMMSLMRRAASIHLVATALHAVQRGRIRIGENVVVAGLGIVGQFACQIAKAAGAYVIGMDRLSLRVDIAEKAGIYRAINVSETDPIPIAEEFTNGYGMDCGIIAFGGDGTSAFQQIRAMLKTAPDTHKVGRIVIVGGANITHGFAAGLGNVDVISAARTGPGYHDEDYEHGADYPPVFVPWPTQRNLELSLRLMSEGKVQVKPVITDIIPIDRAPEGCEKLIQTPNEALGVVFSMQ